MFEKIEAGNEINGDSNPPEIPCRGLEKCNFLGDRLNPDDVDPVHDKPGIHEPNMIEKGMIAASYVNNDGAGTIYPSTTDKGDDVGSPTHLKSIEVTFSMDVLVDLLILGGFH